ncbi:hypothetical protein AaE_013928 [Aphanomyces astaci]|uniref:Uncharacterized protein n=2 Tax=Aphanomyces astaci TaxID=112090 RepID=A0A6A4Z8T7_APHAT|nr:hypothetical protein AaE_013928 [Aphanomyces astaci]
MAPNQESSSSSAAASASLVAAWRGQRMMTAITSPKAKYSYHSGSYATRHAKSHERNFVRRPVPIAIPDVFKSRDRCCVGGKHIPFTRFNTIECRRKVLKEDLDTIHESVYYTDLKWEDLISDLADMHYVDQRRRMAITFIL